MDNFLQTTNFNLLRQSLRLDDPSNAIKAAKEIIEKNLIDWNDLVERAHLNCVKPQLGNLLNKIPAQMVPTEIIEKLKEANLANAYCQMSNLSEFFQIKQLLDEAGIVAIPFKGFWLAQNFYGNLAHRESIDVDLFIDSKDLEKIKVIMHARGYITENTISQLTTNYILKELCEYNFDKYFDNTRVFHFEFHWKIGLAIYEMGISFNDLKSHLTSGFIQNKEIKVFSSSANFLLTVMHHGGKDQYLQLKQVMDIAYLINKQEKMNWGWIVSQAKRFYVEHLIYIAVRMASLLTGTIIPDEIKENVNSKFIQNLATNRIQMMSDPPSNWHSWRHNLLSWNFQIRSRSSRKLKIRLIIYKIRRELLPQLVPKKLHYLFFNNKIRIRPIN